NPSAFAKLWVHNGFLTVASEKMSKSLGNFRLVHDLLPEYPGEVLRLALLSAHYRQPLDWSENLLQQTKNTLDTLYRTLYHLRDVKEVFPSEKSTDPRDAIDIVLDALCDDLNTPKAIAALHHISSHAIMHKSPTRKGELLAAGKLLGILQQDPA